MPYRAWQEYFDAGRAQMRIGLAFFILAIALFGGVGYLSARDAREQTERDAATALQLLADRLAQRLDADMAARHRDIEQLTRLADLMGMPHDATRWREILERLQQSSRHYSWIGVTDAQGRVLASTQGLLESVDVGQRPWFVKGLQGPSVVGVHDAKLLAALLPPGDDGEPLRFVDVASPLMGDQGQTLGVVGAHLSWAWAEERRQEALASEAAQRGIEILLISPEGRIELGPVAPTLPNHANQDMPTQLATPGMRTWTDGQRYLTAARASQPLDTYPGMDWWVVVRQPEHEALAASRALNARLWWMSVIGALLFGALGWLLSGWLTRPLRRVAEQARTLMPTATQPPGAHKVRDEVAQLAQSLGSLQAHTDSLRQANDDLRGFSRSVSHDLQGPLGTMAALLRQNLLREQTTMSDSTARTLQLVAQECDRLKQLSAELLALAMVDQRELSTEPVDHAALVHDVLEQLRAVDPDHFPQTHIGPLPTLPGDALMLRQVWANLLSNAVKFSSKSEHPRIDVTATAHDGEVVYCVADNGVGFDESQAGRLFGVFERLHKASQFPGTGVGLSIVRRVVQRHGGRVWASSPPGAGARFHVALPRQTPP